ncbi:MAG: hypothetical protein AAGJ80_15860 [Cyanobacteria bacterium J06553_1]
MNLYWLPNQPRRHAVKNAANINSAVTANFRAQHFVVSDPPFWQRLQHFFFLLKLGLTLAVKSSDSFIYHRLIVRNRDKVTAATQIDELLDAVLHMAMRRLHATVFVRYSFVVSRRYHSVVVAQVVIQPC